MIDTALQQNIQSIIEENKALALEVQNIETFLEQENLEPKEIIDYRNNSIPKLLWSDFWLLIGGIIGLGIIAGILSAIGLAFLVAIAGILFAFVFLAAYFKQIVIYCVILFILSKFNGTEALMFICTILFVLSCRYLTISKRKEAIQSMVNLQHQIETNYQQIINLATPSVIELIHQERMADVNSIHAHGFPFLSETHIHDILNQYISKEYDDIERITLPQSKTILYKSTRINPDDEMTTTYLEID